MVSVGEIVVPVGTYQVEMEGIEISKRYPNTHVNLQIKRYFKCLDWICWNKLHARSELFMFEVGYLLSPSEKWKKSVVDVYVRFDQLGQSSSSQVNR